MTIIDVLYFITYVAIECSHGLLKSVGIWHRSVPKKMTRRLGQVQTRMKQVIPEWHHDKLQQQFGKKLDGGRWNEETRRSRGGLHSR